MPTMSIFTIEFLGMKISFTSSESEAFGMDKVVSRVGFLIMTEPAANRNLD